MEIVTGPNPAFVAQQQASQPDLLGNYTRLLQLKGLQNEQALAPLRQQEAQQQVQTGQLDLQAKQRQQDSDAAIMQAYQNSGGDLSKTIADATKTGKVLPQSIAALRQANYQVQQEALKLWQAKGERAVQEGDLFDGAADAVHAAPPEQRPAVYQQQMQNLAQAGVDVSQAPQQYPGDQQFDMMRLGIKSHTKALEQVAKQTEIGKNQAQTQEAQATTQQKQAETQFYQQNGGAPGVSAEMIQQADWLKKNPGKGPSDYKLWVLQHSPSAMIMGNQLGGGNNQDALDFAANNYRQTGQLPAGFSRSPGTTSAIIARAAQLDQQQGGSGIAANKTILGSYKDALNGLQKNYSAVSAFETTATKNMDMLENIAKKVPDLGSRFANVPIRMLNARMIGSENMAAFNTALAPVQTEAAKILNSANLTGQLSDSSRHELQAIVDGNLPYKSLKSSLDVLRQDFDNRKSGFEQQISDLQNRIKNGEGGSQQSPGGVGVGAIVMQNGHKYKVTAVDKDGKPTAADPVQ